MKKKLLCAILCCCVLVSLLPSAALAADTQSGTCGTGVSWLYQDGVLTISGSGEMQNYTSGDGAPWVPIRGSIVSVVIEDGVTTIGKYAFYNCIEMRTVSIPEGLTSVGDSSFYKCIKLTEVSLPDSIQNVGNYAFYECSKLVTAELGRTTNQTDDTALQVGTSAFQQCFSLQNVVFHRKLTSISNRMFYYCSNLSEITLPQSLTEIGAYAFAICAIKQITIPDGVQKINTFAFSTCFALENVVIPQSVTSVDRMAFEACENLRNVYYGGSSEAWQAMTIASGNNLLTDANIHNHLTENWSTAWSMDSAHHWHICAAEGCTAEKLFDMAGYGKHVYDQKVETEEYLVTPGTCTEGAVYRYSCICGAAGTETFQAETAYKEHTVSTDWTLDSPPTCTKDGSKSRRCTVCGTAVETVVLPATGHSWDNGIVTKQPTLSEAGQRLYTCTVCGETKTEQLPALKNSFSDVSSSQYYALPIAWAVSAGITNGTTSTTFSPDTVCTRAQIVTFLWRAAGSPEPSGSSNPFADVSESSYFYKAVLWAVEHNITNGTGAGSFSPEASCTRAQAVTFLWRMADQVGSSGTNKFTDVSANAYYYNAVLWAIQNDITNGITATQFAPEQLCTRGQVVTFLYRDMT